MKPLATLPFLLLAAAAQATVPAEEQGETTGGDTTVSATGRNAFSFPTANLSDEERTRFAIGNSFFKRNWVQASASTKARDGLGPHFIARSCGGCHVNDGRGEPPKASELPVSLLLRLSVPGVGEHGGIIPEPTYGDQLNIFAVQGVKPEGQVDITYIKLPGRFADGRPYTLLAPRYAFRDLGYGPMRKDVLVSPRVAPQIIGVGLLEAIAPERHQGRPQPSLGRPLRQDDDGPFRLEGQRRDHRPPDRRGLQRRHRHHLAGVPGRDLYRRPDRLPERAPWSASKAPEIDDKTLGDVVFYQATLALPARRNVNDPQVRRGQKLFAEAQCAVCHRPSHTTADGPNPDLSSPALNGQRIHPYTDLLLHDLGESLADHRPDAQANGRQWKTPPLWGLGLIQDVNNHNRLLHDGRARGVLEAILWHSGEAEAGREAVKKLTKKDREALVKFVESL